MGDVKSRLYFLFSPPPPLGHRAVVVLTPSSGGGFDECTYIPKGVANIPSMSVVPSHVWS